MNQWIQKLKAASKRIDGGFQEIEKEPTKKVVQYYNVHKRSLPIGIDTPVLFGLTREEAEAALRIYKTKAHSHDDFGTVLVYYDMVKADALPVEKSPLYNEGPIMREE